jgi:hypothetical protein
VYLIGRKGLELTLKLTPTDLCVPGGCFFSFGWLSFSQGYFVDEADPTSN